MRLVLEINQTSDLKILLPLLERMGISFIQEWDKKVKAQENEFIPEHKLPMTQAEALEVIEKGCDMSSFGDPVQFQREQRLDRTQPFRND